MVVLGGDRGWGSRVVVVFRSVHRGVKRYKMVEYVDRCTAKIILLL